jgi:hypothetical protein
MMACMDGGVTCPHLEPSLVCQHVRDPHGCNTVERVQESHGCDSIEHVQELHDCNVIEHVREAHGCNTVEHVRESPGCNAVEHVQEPQRCNTVEHVRESQGCNTIEQMHTTEGSSRWHCGGLTEDGSGVPDPLYGSKLRSLNGLGVGSGVGVLGAHYAPWDPGVATGMATGEQAPTPPGEEATTPLCSTTSPPRTNHTCTLDRLTSSLPHAGLPSGPVRGTSGVTSCRGYSDMVTGESQEGGFLGGGLETLVSAGDARQADLCRANAEGNHGGSGPVCVASPCDKMERLEGGVDVACSARSVGSIKTHGTVHPCTDHLWSPLLAPLMLPKYPTCVSTGATDVCTTARVQLDYLTVLASAAGDHGANQVSCERVPLAAFIVNPGTDPPLFKS